MLKIIPTLATVLGVVGAGALVWYYSKTAAERELLDMQANKIALDWYDKAADELPLIQVKRVFEEIQRIARA